MKKLTPILSAIAWITCLGISSGQPAGTLDLNFSSDGIATFTRQQAPNVGTGNVVIQPDQKLVISTSYTNQSFYWSSELLRFNVDGNLDNTFGNSGATIPISALGPRVGVLSTGRVVTCYYESNCSSGYDMNAKRYLSNGVADGNVGSCVDAVANQNDRSAGMTINSANDRVALTGWSDTDPNQWIVAMWNSGLSSVAAFSSDGIVTTTIESGGRPNAAEFQDDNKLVVTGYAEQNGVNKVTLVRYNTDGTLDATFGTLGTGIVLTNFTHGAVANEIAIQPDGKIVVCGTATDSSGDLVLILIRYNADGTIDSSFGSNGVVTYATTSESEGFDLAIQADGKIIVVGYIVDVGDDTKNGLVVRYNMNGSIDTEFANSGAFTTDVDNASDTEFRSVVIQEDDKIVLAGNGVDGGYKAHVLARLHAGYVAHTGIHDQLLSQHLVAYPNPSNGGFTVENILPGSGSVELMVTDLMGHTLFRSNDRIHSGVYRKNLDLNLSQGVYLLMMQTQLGRAVKQIEIIE